MKWLSIPMEMRLSISFAETRLFMIPFPLRVVRFLALKAVASSLKYWTMWFPLSL